MKIGLEEYGHLLPPTCSQPGPFRIDPSERVSSSEAPAYEGSINPSHDSIPLNFLDEDLSKLFNPLLGHKTFEFVNPIGPGMPINGSESRPLPNTWRRVRSPPVPGSPPSTSTA
jgi:hypothetical protein